MQMKEKDLRCWTSRGGRADKSIARMWKQDIWLVIITAGQDQTLQRLPSLGGPMLESRSDFPPLLVVARGRGAPSHPVPPQQPLLWGPKAALPGDTEHHAWLTCPAHFQHPALISSQTGFYLWDTSSDFPFIQKEAAIFKHYRSADNTYYKQQSCEGMPEPSCWLMPDLRKAHVHCATPWHACPSCTRADSVAGVTARAAAAMPAPPLGGPSHSKRQFHEVCGWYLRDLTMKSVVHTHTKSQACHRGESTASKALAVAQNGGPKAPGSLRHPPCRGTWRRWASLPHLTSLPRRSSSRPTPAHGNGLPYLESIGNSI